MGLASAPGRPSWLLAGGLLAAALVLSAGAGARAWGPAGPAPLRRPAGELLPGAGPGPRAQGQPVTRPGADTSRRSPAGACLCHLCCLGEESDPGARPSPSRPSRPGPRRAGASRVHPGPPVPAADRSGQPSAGPASQPRPPVREGEVSRVDTASGRTLSREHDVPGPPPASAGPRGPRAPSTPGPAPPRPRKTVMTTASPLPRRPRAEPAGALPAALESGVLFRKCAEVLGPPEAQTAEVRLLVNDTRAPGAANLSDLVLLDNVTGLTLRGPGGNLTAPGLLAFRRPFLRAGDTFTVSYTAALDVRALGGSAVLSLPAQLSFQTPPTNRTQLKALLTLTVEEKVRLLPNHGLHAAGFLAAFLAALALTGLALLLALRGRCWPESLLGRRQVRQHEGKPEHGQFAAADGVGEDLALGDRMMDVLCSEDPDSAGPALEELEIATLNRADSDLEACRAQISRDVVVLLLRNLSGSGQLAPQAERRMGAAFRKQCLLLEREIQEEFDRKMVALAAECDLEARKKTEAQYQREMAATEEMEEVLKRVGERPAAQCSGLLRALHDLEQEQLRRSLALQQEEDFARARRQLAVSQRRELHGLFFAQVKSALGKGELTPAAAKTLLQDYSRVQGDTEELMDFLQASKRRHLDRRFGHRERLVQSLRAAETRAQGLLSAAAAQLSLLIQKHERAGYLDEDQTEALLERAQTEVFSIKQKLDNDLKQEKRKLCQKLMTRRRREMLQKHKEQRKEQLALGEASQAAEDVDRFLGQWRGLLAEQAAALEELQERLDQAALDELRALTLALAERAREDLWRLQHGALTQELLKRGVPWLFLQQILEEHGQELATRAGQLEAEERGRGQEGVRGARQRLRDDALEAAVEEQAELRRWEGLVFAKLCVAPLSLSAEESLGVRQEAHGCFAQLDRSLALPKIRAQVLLQQLQAAWREAEGAKLDKALATPDLQHPPKARKSRCKGRSRTELLRKSLEDKIQLFEEQAPEDLVEKVRGELRAERVRQLEAQEARFAESLVALQFQKVARAARTLGVYTALLSVQGLLLAELRESETLTTAACAQVLESHGPELQELERKLEAQLAQQEVAGLQRVLGSGQPGAGEAPWLLAESEAAGVEEPVSSVLQRALRLGPQCLEWHQQGLREELQAGAALEDSLEKMENDAFATLYGQELRLASYLSKLSMVPGATLRRLLSVALPTASQPELLALLDSVSQRHPDQGEERDPGEQADLGRSGKHRAWWRALDAGLREDLRCRGLERLLWARRRKESILKKRCPPLGERVAFSGEGDWPHLTLESGGELAPVPIVGVETIDVLDTGEKLFLFRTPAEPEVTLRIPPRKKKKNFLNAKKAAWALALD